ncbi:hypothetical protein DAETH_37110 (plasmid) [Deinococcus aetherius]|uniref:Transposase n=1 Tax=Deinococcus aetherius TaxID=200252 RepID=A0ABM8AIU0_9DEIO|nr:hypothetical protein DAETH_37110 [Deinococcus aetherius]
MGLLHQVVTTGGRDHLDVLHPVEHGKLAQGRARAPELIGVDDLWGVVFPQQALKERPGSLGIAVLLKEDVQHSTVFIDRPPQPVGDAPDIHAHLIEVPPGAAPRFPVAEVLGKKVAELDAPGPDGLAGDGDAPLQQEFFDVPVAEGKPVVQLLRHSRSLPGGIGIHGASDRSAPRRPTPTTCHNRFPLSVIGYALRLYHRFPLSQRDVQELLQGRGIVVSHETLRQWNRKFVPLLTEELRQREPRRGSR